MTLTHPPVGGAPPATVDSQLPTGDERLLQSLARLFGALRAPRQVVERFDAGAAAIAEALERRARRRRARFDLLLHEAPAEHAADMALALRAQQGSAAAVVEIRRLLEPVVVARVYAARLQWNRDELVHDVLGRIWEKLGTYNGTASLKTWGGRVAYNYLMNWIRDNRTRHRAELPIEVEGGGEERAVQATDGRGADVPVLAGERAARIERLAGELARLADAALTPDEWALLQELVIDGTPRQAVADRLGVKPGTLGVRLFRAVRKLRTAALAANGAEFGETVLDALARE